MVFALAQKLPALNGVSTGWGSTRQNEGPMTFIGTDRVVDVRPGWDGDVKTGLLKSKRTIMGRGSVRLLSSFALSEVWVLRSCVC